MSKSCCTTLIAGLASLLPGAALAQEAPPENQDVVDRADDAFGVRVGVERFGLYSESLARGFSLEAAANYRIDGLYYVPSGTPSNPTIDVATIRVGLNAVPFDFPAPSGVVDYALRGPAEKPFLTARTGIDRYESIFVESDFSVGSPRLGLAGGFQAYPSSQYADGSYGNFYSVGFVPQWQPSDRTRVRGLAGASRWRYSGDEGYASDGSTLPPVIGQLQRLGVPNGKFEQRISNFGMMFDQDLGFAELRAGGFHSRRETPFSDFTIVSGLGANGRGKATLFTSPDRDTRTWSGEASLIKRFRTGDWQHRVLATVRMRSTDTVDPLGRAIDLGAVVIGDKPLLPVLIDRSPTGFETRNKIEQRAFGVSYRLARANKIELRAGVQRMRYQKRVTRTGDASSATLDNDWLYNGSIVWQPAEGVTAFASYTRGLEESGTAPASATNRNEVLPAVLARQAEAGVRVEFSPNISVGVSGFTISKPTPAFDASGAFRLLGTARYDGIEGSLNARFENGLALVLGAVAIDLDRRSGRDAPTLAAAGLAAVQGLIGATYTPTFAKDLSFDTQINLQGPKWVDAGNTLQTTGFTTINLGARYQFGNGGPNIRVQVVNATNTRQWSALPSQLLGFVVPRTFRLVVSQTLG